MSQISVVMFSRAVFKCNQN